MANKTPPKPPRKPTPERTREIPTPTPPKKKNGNTIRSKGKVLLVNSTPKRRFKKS